MNWMKNIDIITFNDSWQTWNTHFRNNINPKISLSKFYKLALRGEYYDMSINDYIDLKPENSGLHRLKAKTVEEAYSDKPRGNKDIEKNKYEFYSYLFFTIQKSEYDL
jgi:hypothetical protein